MKKNDYVEDKKRLSLFRAFSSKGVTKDDEFSEIPINFKGFFVMLGRKFWNISNLSLLYSFVNLPVLFFLLGYSMRQAVSVVSNPMNSVFYSFWQITESPELASVFPFVNSVSKTYVSGTASYVFYAIAALFLFTFGISNAGAACVVRGYNRGDPVFLISDFFGAIKRNWKQAIIIGILDIVFSFALVFDYLFWQGQPGFISGIFMYFALFLCVLYFFMRFYIYTIMITFDLSIYKIFKDAFLLSFLGFKRNFAALIGIILVLAASMYLCLLYLPIGIILPIILTLGLLMFISGYASYPVIKKYMIDPYYKDEEVAESDDEPVFEDRG